MRGPSRVLVTKAEDFAQRLGELLGEVGFETRVWPLLRFIRANRAPLGFKSLTELGSNPLDFDWLLTTSSRSVEFMRLAGLVLPKSLRIGSVGPAATRRLVEAGYNVCCQAKPPYSSAALLEELAGLSGQKFLVLASDLSDDSLARGLTAAGHAVCRAVAYRTRPQRLSLAKRKSIESGYFKSIVLMSPSAVDSLSRQAVIPPECLLVVPGKKTARAARQISPRVLVAKEASAQGINRAILSALTPRL